MYFPNPRCCPPLSLFLPARRSRQAVFRRPLGRGSKRSFHRLQQRRRSRRPPHRQPDRGNPRRFSAHFPATSTGDSEQVRIRVSGDSQTAAQSPANDTQEGLIQEVTCGASSVSAVRFAILGKTLSLAAPDSRKIALRLAGKDSNLSATPCDQWKGRKARISYAPSANEKSPAAILSIDLLRRHVTPANRRT